MASFNNNNRAPKRGRGGGGKGPKSNVCYQFQRGECSRGSDCRFDHEEASLKASGDSNNSLSDPTAKVPRTGGTSGAKKGNGSRGVPRDDAKISHMAAGAGDATVDSAAGGGKVKKPRALDVPKGANMPEMTSDTVADSGKAGGHITQERFSALPISAESRRAMAEVFKYEFMTSVQAGTLPTIIQGHDCLAKAKTGTGKTLGFLIPTIENIVLGRRNGLPSNMLSTLIISPTRELASQIATEAEQLTRFHNGLKVVTVVGGTNISKDNRALTGRVDILVATPGRLLDHLQQGMAARFARMQVLIMDEADQLLDMGFRPDIEKILALLPQKSARQTLLFSATIPKTVKEVARQAMKGDFKFVDTVGEEAEQTHKHVKQELVVCPQSDIISSLAEILKRAMAEANNEHKIIVFFTTARVTGFMSELMNLAGFQILEMHSRKSQAQRTKTSDRFRTARCAIMFSSDVSARGMDYPDVSFVLQVGLTDREQYIHRLGRTARAGKSGSGMLLLMREEERQMRRDLHDMPLISFVPAVSMTTLDATRAALARVSRNAELRKSAEQAYGAWLGYYNTNCKKCGWNKEQLVQKANEFAQDLGLTDQPKLQKKTIGKMGLKGVPGLLTE